MGLAVYLTSLASSGLASLVLTPLVLRSAKKWGVVDVPNSRKIHSSPTPRLGGLAVAGAFFAVAVPLLIISGAFSAAADERKIRLIVVLSAAAFVLLVGVFDDILNLPSQFKLLALLAGATAVCGAGVRIDAILIHGQPPIDFGWAAWPLTLLWIVGITVSINFIDGLDGLAAGICAIACIVVAVAAGFSDQPCLVLLALSLFGSLAGFLVFNFHPAKVFMGDCGSMFIGFLFACLCLLGAPKLGTTTGLMLPALALSIPLLDTLSTLIRRTVIFRRSIFSAERGHIHHRLLDLGLGQTHAVLLLYAATVLSAGVGLLALLERGWATATGLTLLIPLLAVLFHIAGSARVRETIAAVRRNRAIGREAKHYQRAYEELQLRFRPINTFDAWWTEVRGAGQLLDFVRITLPITRRDGSCHVLTWQRTDDLLTDSDTMTATIPIPQRRSGGPVRAELEVAIHTLLESAGQRVALFSRLMGEHGIAYLPDSTRKVARSRGPAGTGHKNNGDNNGHADHSLERNETGQVISDHDGPKATMRQRVSGRNGDASHRGKLSKKLNGHRQVTRPQGTPSPVGLDTESLDHLLGQEWTTSRVTQPHVAIVHDFLYCYAGAERVLEQIIRVFPDADLFSLFDFIPSNQRAFLNNKPVRTTFIQRLPLARRKHRAYLPLMPLAIEQLDLTGYEIVISSSYLVAKGVLTRPDQLHVCYCHTPVRFAWDLQHQYLGNAGMVSGLKSLLARLILHYIRSWDIRTSNGVDVFLTNSDFVGRRIEKVYRRTAKTIYPPVNTDAFTLHEAKEDFYLTVSRMVPYKRVDLIVEAFRHLPDRRLIVVGDGPEYDKIKARATPNIRLVGHQPLEKLKQYMQLARAFVFAAEEDFGIVPVEAQACGTPVIAFGRGGVTESVIEGQTGIFFAEQTPEAIVRAIQEFERGTHWAPAAIRQNAERFSAARFREDLERLVRDEWLKFLADRLELSPRPSEHGTGTSDLTEGHQSGEVQVGLPLRAVGKLSLPLDVAS